MSLAKCQVVYHSSTGGTLAISPHPAQPVHSDGVELSSPRRDSHAGNLSTSDSSHIVCAVFVLETVQTVLTGADVLLVFLWLWRSKSSRQSFCVRHRCLDYSTLIGSGFSVIKSGGLSLSSAWWIDHKRSFSKKSLIL